MLRRRVVASLVCTFVLSWSAVPGAAADGPRCLLREGFEAEGAAFRLKQGAAVVSREQGAEPHGGNRCLRGNWNPKVTDPITGITGAKGAGMDLELAKVGVRTQCYVSLYWRLDPEVKFETENKGQPGAFPGYKLAYIMGAPWDNTVNWVIGQPYTIDSWWLVDNVPKENTGYLVRVKTSAEAGRAGGWHHVEFYLKMNSAPRAPDGACWLRVDGETVFDRTDVPFMHATADETWGSVGLPCMFGGAFAPAGSFGWQLDDLEVWDGVPPVAQKKETPASPVIGPEPATR